MKLKQYIYSTIVLSIAFPLIEILLYPKGILLLSILFKINQFSILPAITFAKKIKIPIKMRLFIYYCICLAIVAVNVEIFDPKNTTLRILSVIVPMMAMIIAWSISVSEVRKAFEKLYSNRHVLYSISWLAIGIYYLRSLIPVLQPIPNAIHSSLWLTLGLELSGRVSISFFIIMASLTVSMEIISLKRTGLIITLTTIIASMKNVSSIKLVIEKYSKFKLTLKSLGAPILITIILSIILIAQTNIGRRLKYTYETLTSIDSLTEDIYLDRLTSGRSSEIEVYLSMLKENPIYIYKGVPTHEVITLCNYNDECDSRYYLHNNFFSLSYQFGLPMAILIYLELINITYNAMRKMRSNQFESILAIICLGTMINSLASSVFTLYTLPFFIFTITQKIYSDPYRKEQIKITKKP